MNTTATPPDATDPDGAFVEHLAEALGPMLLPEDLDRLVGLARRAAGNAAPCRPGRGHVVLASNLPDAHQQESPRFVTHAQIEQALAALGWQRWPGDGFPAVVVLAAQAAKGDYFEAGYWAGAGVPVVFLAGGHSAAKRKHIVHRFRGWNAVDGLAGLAAALARVLPAREE